MITNVAQAPGDRHLDRASEHNRRLDHLARQFRRILPDLGEDGLLATEDALDSFLAGTGGTYVMQGRNATKKRDRVEAGYRSERFSDLLK